MTADPQKPDPSNKTRNIYGHHTHRSDGDGWCYVLQGENSGAQVFKVGVTQKPNARVKSAARQGDKLFAGPLRAQEIACIWFDEYGLAAALEKHFLETYADLRVSGSEWLAGDPARLEAFLREVSREANEGLARRRRFHAMIAVQKENGTLDKYDDDPRWLGARAAAIKLGVSMDTLRRMAEAGRFPGAWRTGVSGHWRIPEVEVYMHRDQLMGIRRRA